MTNNVNTIKEMLYGLKGKSANEITHAIANISDDDNMADNLCAIFDKLICEKNREIVRWGVLNLTVGSLLGVGITTIITSKRNKKVSAVEKAKIEKSLLEKENNAKNINEEDIVCVIGP